MKLIDAEALRDWFGGQGDVIATTDVQALIDNWPAVRCGECVQCQKWVAGGNSALCECEWWEAPCYLHDGCSYFERRTP